MRGPTTTGTGPLLLTATLAALLGSVSAAPAADDPAERRDRGWPQWRGAHRDAVSSETGLIGAWPDGGPEVLWRVPIGAGYSGVAVAGGSLYTAWDDGPLQVLGCLDARTGAERWRQVLGAAFSHHYGDGPRSTPLVDDGVVFAAGTAGRLLAVDAGTGEVLWSHNLVREFGARLPSYGYASSPLLSGDKLIVEAAAPDAAYIAFDRKTGEVAWASANDRPAYSSPIGVSIDGVRQIVFWGGSGLHALQADSGKVLWDYRWETLCPVSGEPLNTGTPIHIAPDRIFISSGSGAAVIRIARSGKDGAFVPETVWTSQEMRSDVNTSLLFGEHIYGFDRGILKCLDAATGELRWRARGFEKGSLIAADGKLIVLGEAGNLALVEATPERFLQRDSADVLDGRCWTAPSLADGRLYLRNHEELIAVNLRG